MFSENVFWQEPMTRSLHTYCTLESTLSRFLLFLERENAAEREKDQADAGHHSSNVARSRARNTDPHA